MTSPYLLEQRSIPVPRELAGAIGLEESTVLQQLYYCLMNTKLLGMEADDCKWIRNPVKCTNSEKLQRAQEHGKDIDWLGNFPYLTAHKIRRIFTKLEDLGLVVSRKLRAHRWDHCKYYTIDWLNLTELLKSLSLPICEIPTHPFNKTGQMDLATERKSYQITTSTKDLQLGSHTEAGGTVSELLDKKQEIGQDKKQPEDSLLETRVVSKPLPKKEVLHEGKYFAPSSSVERDLFFQRLLMYCYQRVDIDSPEGYANWVLRECRSREPEASVALLWEEFKAGEELGSRMVAPGFKLRGVPEKVVAEAIAQDCTSKVGATLTEAAKNAAGQLRRLPVVAAVANAVKVLLERTIEDATRQVELGVPKERAIANNLPTYAIACVENSLPQIEAAVAVEEDVTTTVEEEVADPYAPTPESIAAREKAKAKLRNKFSFSQPTKAEVILAANIAEVEFEIKTAPAVQPTKAVIYEEYDDEPILW